jgi:hypothetical protein
MILTYVWEGLCLDRCSTFTDLPTDENQGPKKPAGNGTTFSYDGIKETMAMLWKVTLAVQLDGVH